MRKAYEPLKAQADSAVHERIFNERAWIGPSDALISEDPVIGEPVHVELSYRNTGRSPAGSENQIATFAVDPKEACMRANHLKDVCMHGNIGEERIIVWPTTGDSQYSIVHPGLEQGTIFNQSLRAGETQFMLYGCFRYADATGVHHSAFCYYSPVKKVQKGKLGICVCGQDAD